MDLNLFNWNVRGLHNPAKRRTVAKLIADLKCNIVCLQETKLEMMDIILVAESVGARFSDNFVYKPAAGSRGGILIACSDDFSVEPLLSIPDEFSITATITDKSNNASWSITAVYGPQNTPDKLRFLTELAALKPLVLKEWLVLGDFNLICKAEEKSNTNVNFRLMGQFRNTIDLLEMRDLPLCGKKFTWSNERAGTTLTRIDRMLISNDWELRYPQYQLSPASSAVSDHSPLLLKKMDVKVFKGFRFEAYWLKLQDIDEVVSLSWNKPLASAEPVRRLHAKLARTALALKRWEKKIKSASNLAFNVENEVIFNLDLAMEERELSEAEWSLRRKLKARLLGIAAMGRIAWRQRSRITKIKASDASSKLFHLRANGRRRKNHIPSLQSQNGAVTDHKLKEEILLNHFKSLMGTRDSGRLTINWAQLQHPTADLQHLELPFTEDEIKGAVFDLHDEKAPGPDGFIGKFFKRFWSLIKDDLVAAVHQLFCLRGGNWRLLNSAHIVLLPKSTAARCASDFRPVSLIHSFAKIFCKLLANRLGPELQKLISCTQSAFIQGRSIQDNFLYVQNTIKNAYKKNIPLVFLKLDFAKAFDSVHWPYLIDVMKAYGFGQRWRDIICQLLASSSSRILLNGCPGPAFTHLKGLRQGDPLSPMLFILAMDPLLRMLDAATARGLLEPIPQNAVRMRASLYADDAAIFVSPNHSQIMATLSILEAFGNISGLKINPAKCVAYPIRCHQVELQSMLPDFEGPVGSFPCKYLGLPLSFRRLRRIDLQPFLDKGAGRMSIWKGKLLNRTGRLDLINSVLSATITFFLTSFAPSGWFTRKFDKLRRNFLWNADEEAHGGKCLVNWKMICAPKNVGGLGIKDIQAFGRALRLRWPWFEWDNLDRPWKGTPVPCEMADLNLFAACTSISLGDGLTAKFWSHRWLGGNAPKELAPGLYNLARSKQLTVREALHNGSWMRGLRNINSAILMDSFIDLWWRLQETVLLPRPDTISWNFSPNGEYSAKSAYLVQFLTRIPQPHLHSVWNIKAERKIKFFVWTLLQNRLWTADRLLARRWDHNDACSAAWLPVFLSSS